MNNDYIGILRIYICSKGVEFNTFTDKYVTMNAVPRKHFFKIYLKILKKCLLITDDISVYHERLVVLSKPQSLKG